MRIKSLLAVLTVFLTLLLSFILVNAEIDLSDAINGLSAEVAGKVLPNPLSKLAGDEKINIYLEMENGEELIIGLITENGAVKSLAVAEVKYPTIKVYSSESALREIILSTNKPQTLLTALKEKKLNYQGVGLKNKIKLFIASSIVKISGWFQNEESAPVEVFAKETPAETANSAESNDSNIDDSNSNNNTNSDSNESKADSNENVAAGENETSSTTTDGDALTGGIVAEVKTTKSVNLIEGGFNPETIRIKAGNTVEWKNIRSGRFKQALIIGTRNCREIKSTIYNSGESFSWTFNEPITCVVADGIYTTETMTVIVE